MLRVEGLHAGYGKKHVLHGIAFEVGEGEVVSLIGRNGMGKTTTFRAIMGLLPASAGRITFNGRDITNAAPERISRLGVGYVPEGRGIFPTLSVFENLIMSARPGPWTLGVVYDMFPRLRERADNMGFQLSGGEQQMLSIGRALLLNPSLVLLDEATEGLAPIIQDEIWDRVMRISRKGLSLLVVDKDLKALQRIATRHYVLHKGEIRWSGSSNDLSRQDATLESYIAL
jgi:branched-chain amino acid transport system ATP-binding protein